MLCTFMICTEKKRSKYMKLFRKLILVLVVTVLSLFVATPALAIDVPDVTMKIDSVWAYRNCKETGDQLYIVDYTIDYTVNPTQDIHDTFLLVLMNGTTQLGSVAPYSYYNDGYDRGAIALYFSAADAPAWNGSYTMKLVGNPGLTWVPSIPEVSVYSFDLWQDNPISITKDLVSQRVLWLAAELEATWAGATANLVDTTASGSVLTDYGELYFGNVIPDLRTVAPSAFAGQVIQPDVTKRTYTQDYAGDLTTVIIGTPLDLTPTATAFGVSRGALTALLYYAVVILFLIIAARRIGSYKPVMLLSIPLIILGAFIGVPLVITVLVGFFCFILIGFALFYKPSSA